MSSGPRKRSNTPKATAAEQSSRLRLKPAAPITGYVDGAWWPRSRDLSAELPELLAALAARLGGVHRIAYHLDEWDRVAERSSTGGYRVRLRGFHHQIANTVNVTGSTGRLTLLVIPPETAPADARSVSAAAASGGNLDSVENLLARHLPVTIPAPRAAPDCETART